MTEKDLEILSIDVEHLFFTFFTGMFEVFFLDS